jgi:hypothetical protein
VQHCQNQLHQLLILTTFVSKIPFRTIFKFFSHLLGLPRGHFPNKRIQFSSPLSYPHDPAIVFFPILLAKRRRWTADPMNLRGVEFLAVLLAVSWILPGFVFLPQYLLLGKGFLACKTPHITPIQNTLYNCITHLLLPTNRSWMLVSPWPFAVYTGRSN